MKKIAVSAVIVVFVGVQLIGARISVADELTDIEALKQQVEALQSQLQALTEKIEVASEQIKQNTEAAEVAVSQVETLTIGGTGGAGDWASKTRLGGYADLHYNNLDSGSEFDFHRFVLFINHEFSNRVRFFSELELEHSLAGDGAPGEVELEQAWIEYDLSENTSSVAGLFLVPVGILNETHEPPTFYGVERNEVEKNIIPTTWWEAGAGVKGRSASGFSWDLAMHSGLATAIEGSNAYKIRNSRQKVAEAPAEDFAFTGRIRYTGIPGLELSATAQYQADITQGLISESASATLFEAHAAYQSGSGFGLRALYAMWNIDADRARVIGRDKQEGFYIEPSYRINDAFGVFARYSEWNNEAGLASSQATTQFDVGFNWWLHENVVVKVDYENQGGSNDVDGFNVGLGFQY
jgi:hypothetical protein